MDADRLFSPRVRSFPALECFADADEFANRSVCFIFGAREQCSQRCTRLVWLCFGAQRGGGGVFQAAKTGRRVCAPSVPRSADEDVKKRSRRRRRNVGQNVIDLPTAGCIGFSPAQRRNIHHTEVTRPQPPAAAAFILEVTCQTLIV